MNTTIDVPLLRNEIIFDYWDIYYTLIDGICFFGKLTVTNKRIFFETKINGAVQTMLASCACFTNHTPHHVILSKKHIKLVETIQDASGNKIVLSLSNGEKHILDRKMLAIDKIVVALNQK